MPNFDGTGPRGMGKMTGRGMGFCVMPVSQLPPNQPQPPLQPGYYYGRPWAWGMGGSRGWGRGRGRGFGRRFQ